MKTIVVVERESVSVDGARRLRAYSPGEQGPFEYLLRALWESLTNESSRPAVPNSAGQYPLMDFYENGNLCLDEYLGIDDLAGTKVTTKATYVPGEGLVFGSDAELVVRSLNAALAELPSSPVPGQKWELRLQK